MAIILKIIGLRMIKVDQILHFFQPAVKRHLICDNMGEAFRGALLPSNNLIIWERNADTHISAFIAQLHLSTFMPLNFLATKGKVKENLQVQFADYIPLHSKGFYLLMADISLLTESFLELCGKQQLRLHLRTVEDDACSKFHVDGYPMRLICTYDGPGTEWLPNDKVNRKALGTTNRRIVTNPMYIRQMKPFHVGIMKGDILGPNTKNGVVHRSPSIKEKGLKRFVLRLDI